MEIDELFGLPAHPLLVHIPVVVIPAAFGVALLALWPRVRWAAAVVAALLAVVGGVGAFLAVGAGEKLEDRLPEADLIDDHTDRGEAVELPAIGFALVAVAGAGLVELGRRNAARTESTSSGTAPWATAVLVASVILGGYTTYTVAQAGHSGAKAVWDGTPDSGDDGGSGSSDGGSGDEDGGGSGQGRGRGRGGDDPDSGGE